MSISRKYGRTYHYPFSPGTTSDDRINHGYWRDVQAISNLVHTEKLDGENNCLSAYGVFARSHTAPTASPWTRALRERWQSIRHDLNDIEIFGENLYAVHSIAYKRLEHHYYVFAARCQDTWLCWEEVKWYAAFFDLAVVPELKVVPPSIMDERGFREEVLMLAGQASLLEAYDAHTLDPCTREGIVSRNAGEFRVADFAHHVFKYVRKDHVKTDEHWTRNWKRARLRWEYPAEEII